MTRFNTQLVHGLPVGDNNTGAAFFMLWFRLRWQRAVGVADWGG